MIPALFKSTAVTIVCLVFCARHIDAFDEPAVSGIVKIRQKSFDGKGVDVVDFSRGIIVHDDLMFRHGYVTEPKMWPSNVIPIHSFFDKSYTSKLMRWLRSVEKHSCVRIVQHKDEKDYISLTNIDLPKFSELGFQGGEQVMNLNIHPSKGAVLHLFLHSLGFWHEHTRVDRDKYVSIVWDNIDPSDRDYFQKHVREVYGQPYDFESIMHGKGYDFALDDDISSIVPVVRNLNISKPMGQRKRVSKIDFAKLNKMFNCGE